MRLQWLLAGVPHLRTFGRSGKDGRGVWRNVVEGVWGRPTAGGQGV